MRYILLPIKIPIVIILITILPCVTTVDYVTSPDSKRWEKYFMEHLMKIISIL